MKIIITILMFTSFVATSAVAKTEKGNTARVDRSNIYQSDSLGHQSYPNPNRDFGIENLRSHAN
jgi:hypothetical protein